MHDAVAAGRHQDAASADKERMMGRGMGGGRKLLKTPQQKKEQSYSKDTRNNYGENNKAARKTIPRRKALENRDDRRKTVQALSGLPRLDEAAGAVVESSARNGTNRVGGWTKCPDVPLREHLLRRPRYREVEKPVA